MSGRRLESYVLKVLMKKIAIIIIFTLILDLTLFAADDTKLLRMPDIDKDLIVFVYAGDIWSVPSAGGDPSLEKAVAFLLEVLKKNPPKKITKPGDPDRSQWHEKKK